MLERYHIAFARAGAGAPPRVKARLAAIAERLAALGTQFGQNVLADEKGWTLRPARRGGSRRPAGFPRRAAAAKAAADRGHAGLACHHAVALARSSRSCNSRQRRDLRETAFKAWLARGEAGETRQSRDHRRDGRACAPSGRASSALRASRISVSTTPWRRRPRPAMDLLASVWEPARAQGARGARGAAGPRRGGRRQFRRSRAWDWRFYAERRRKARVRPRRGRAEALPAARPADRGRLRHGARACSASASSSASTSRPIIEDVRVFEVKDADGRHVGLFLGDYFARPSKRSGAWMSAYRSQEKLDGDIRPIIVNVMNFAKAADGQRDAALLRRCAHAVPRVRPRAARPPVGRHLSADLGHERRARLRRVPLAALRALARAARDPRALRPPLPQRRADAAERSSTRFWRAASSTRASRRSSTSPRRSSTSTCISSPSRGRSMPTAFERALLDRDRHAGGDGDAPSPAAFPARLRRRRLFLGLLQLSLVGGARRRRLPGLRGGGRHLRSRDRRESCATSSMPPAIAATPDEAYRAFRGRDPDPAALLDKRGLVSEPPGADA